MPLCVAFMTSQLQIIGLSVAEDLAFASENDMVELPVMKKKFSVGGEIRR